MQYTHAHPLPAVERLDVKSASHRIDSAHPTPTVPRENLPRYTAPAPTLSTNISISNGETQRGYVNPASLGAHKHIPAIKDYDLAHQVRERFDSLSPAIERFNDVVTRFNSNLLDAHQFFGALYELFYWSDSLNLLEILKTHIPNHFRIRDVNNFYEQLRAMAEDRAKRHEDVAAMRDALRSWARKTATEQERSGESSNTEHKEQQEAPTSVKARRQSKRASKGKATASLIVKLPIGASAVPSQPRLDNTVNVTEKPRNPKRRPRNGFKASDRPSETVEANEKDDIEKCGEVKAERPDLIIKECPETAGVTLINKKTEKSLPACQTPASWVDHIGPVYKTRWQILARDSKPYIHEPCKQGFEHPSLVRQHHPVKDPAKGETGEWCTEMLAKMENGVWQEWDHHESCKVTEANINYTMVKDGYVIADQESVDKIEGAVDKGMDFKLQTSLWEEAQKKQAVASTSAAAHSVEPVQSTETTATASSSAPGSSMKKSAVDGTTVAKAVVSAAAAKTPVKKVPAKRANPSSSKHGSTPQKRRYVVAGASDDDREAEARAVEILANGVKCRK
ncbi:hypothetical protein Tdes44962_MAKER02637 [Teratosphaeria destructans]|uniref:Uncharacterized protein n=1 Tax=Teratosphaeria destructans TaxID=418781 RepID=A0A9W7ST81_9PEZI|nr:hypothetical protein Tdes44962_MAKER02637 [Teratosphaeria destructans]